jgi:hypothetical protein
MMETVRFLIHETPVPNGGASKIPCPYQQQRRLRAQFDGSVGNPLTRNSLAALGVGASVYNLRVSGILGTMQQSYVFVKTLDGPRYADLNGPDAHAPDQARVQRGHDAYMQYCSSCHGWPEGENWTTGSIAGFDPHYSIHLGDVYYVGDRNETGENFLGIDNPHNHYKPCRWPTGSLGSFALNGNHEMYALGTGYFDEILPALGVLKDGQPEGQRASYFCLENEYWRIIALDTGYKSIGVPVLEYFWPPDCGMPAGLLQWLRKVVQRDRRGTILLSHHNYFSRYDTAYPHQAVQLKEFFAEHPVLWFWGHEHRLMIYKEYRFGGGIRALGRCIGHGGMPIELPTEVKDSNCPVEFEDSRLYPNDENLTVGYNGFATLVLHGNQLEVRYIDVFGDTVFSEQWSARDGVLTRTAGGTGVAAAVR